MQYTKFLDAILTIIECAKNLISWIPIASMSEDPHYRESCALWSHRIASEWKFLRSHGLVTA